MTTPAERAFAANREKDKAETAIWELLVAAGIEHDDFSYDYYDGSIELLQSTLAELTEEQQRAIWALGFVRAWLHGTAGEKYYVQPVSPPERV